MLYKLIIELNHHNYLNEQWWWNGLKKTQGYLFDIHPPPL